MLGMDLHMRVRGGSGSGRCGGVIEVLQAEDREIRYSSMREV